MHSIPTIKSSAQEHRAQKKYRCSVNNFKSFSPQLLGFQVLPVFPPKARCELNGDKHGQEQSHNRAEGDTAPGGNTTHPSPTGGKKASLHHWFVKEPKHDVCLCSVLLSVHTASQQLSPGSQTCGCSPPFHHGKGRRSCCTSDLTLTSPLRAPCAVMTHAGGLAEITLLFFFLF